MAKYNDIYTNNILNNKLSLPQSNQQRIKEPSQSSYTIYSQYQQSRNIPIDNSHCSMSSDSGEIPFLYNYNKYSASYNNTMQPTYYVNKVPSPIKPKIDDKINLPSSYSNKGYNTNNKTDLLYNEDKKKIVDLKDKEEIKNSMFDQVEIKAKTPKLKEAESVKDISNTQIFSGPIVKVVKKKPSNLFL